MRKIFTHVDDALIDTVCQPAVDQISAITTFGCYRISRVCLDLSSLAWIMSQAGAAAAAAKSEIPGLMALQGVVIVLGLGAISTLRSVFGRSGAPSGLANPLRQAMTVHRLGCLLWLTLLVTRILMTPSTVASLTLFAVGVFATTAVYIGACSNRPPRRRPVSVGSWQPVAARGT